MLSGSHSEGGSNASVLFVYVVIEPDDSNNEHYAEVNVAWLIILAFV